MIIKRSFIISILHTLMFKMKKSVFFVFTLFVFATGLNAQTIKTDVVVIGNGNNAIAAGLQSAISGVKTTLLVPGPSFVFSSINANLSSGIEAEFLTRIRKVKGITDSTAVVSVDNESANKVVLEWADSTKKLTVIKAAQWTKFKRSGSGWNIQLNNGTTIKAKVLVNADQSGKVNAEIGIPAQSLVQWKELNYGDQSYRTSVASGFSINSAVSTILSLYSMLLPDQENLVVLNASQQSMAGGQAAGATAAYAAFFGTKTSLSNLKTIQGELVNYKLSLMPFVDVPDTNANWKAIQFVGVSGLLKAKVTNGKAAFLPDAVVTTEEIKQPAKDFFYKAQIWFDDYKEATMTIHSTLKLASFVGNKSLTNTIAEVQKKWKTNYRFTTSFDLERAIARDEFAAILQDYLPPFNVTIDKTGRITR